MTANNLMAYEPIATDGKVLIDKKIYEELKAHYFKSIVLEDIEISRQQAREGKTIPADEVFARLEKKYGYKRF